MVSARNDTTAEYAQSAGTMDNFVMSLQKGATAFDCINQMHTKHVATFNNPSTDLATKKEQWRRYRTKCEMGMRFSSKTTGSMMVLAGVRPELWGNIEKIFKGEVEDNPDIKQRKPDTHGHFVNMSEIPFNKLMDWTGRVVLGQINTKMFNDKCLLYKKVLRVQGDILEHVNSKRPGVNNGPRFENFNDMAEEYTCFSDYGWFHRLVAWCTKATKNCLSSHAKNSINAALDLHDQRAAENQPVLPTRLLYITTNTRRE